MARFYVILEKGGYGALLQDEVPPCHSRHDNHAVEHPLHSLRVFDVELLPVNHFRPLLGQRLVNHVTLSKQVCSNRQLLEIAVNETSHIISEFGAVLQWLNNLFLK